jgi:ABC-2 type transport system ATP-binding protein
VDGVSFSVERGDVLGFLGPNGAGKSTTMRMITGFLPPTRGTAVVGGHDITDDAIAAKTLIGYLPENAPAYPEMTVQAFLAFMAKIRGHRGAEARKMVEKAIETCFLQTVRHQPIETLSKGFRHRACFAQAILHDPPVLILDEPTDGLDPNQKREMRNLIRRMGKSKAIILSTHILEEVDAVCTRVVIIDQGRIVFNGSPDELRGKSETAGAVTVSMAGDKAAIKKTLNAIPAVKDVVLLRETGDGLSFRLTPKEGAEGSVGLAAEVAKLVTTNGWQLSELSTDPGRLDEVFSKITVSETGRKEEAA